jgi:hypothetical protein
MPSGNVRLYLINAFIAAVLAMHVLDALPTTPLGVRLAAAPLLTRVGLEQGPWTMFAPEPDRMNLRLRAEITYRDGKQVICATPVWREESVWRMFLDYRRRLWWDRATAQSAAPAWQPWCRYLARTERPDLPDADGAEVKLIYQEAPVPPAEGRPWSSIRQSIPYDAGWVLTIEKFE